jgi:hypothetical protein
MIARSLFARYCASFADFCRIRRISPLFLPRPRGTPRRRRGSWNRFHSAAETLEQRLCLSGVFQVTNSADNLSAGSLRFEINQANQSDDPSAIVEITASVTGPINLIHGEVQILADMSIVNHSGAMVEIHQSTPSSRVFYVGPDALNVTLGSLDSNEILIDGGAALGANGGGILDAGDSSQLTLTNVTVENNSAVANHGTGGVGGGIYSSGSVILIDSIIGTIADPNTADLLGGGVWAQDGVSLDSSHVDGNHAATWANLAGQGGGGGIFVNDGGVTLDDGSSVNHNTAQFGEGGGISVAAGYVQVSGASHVDFNSAQDVGGILVGAIDSSLGNGPTAVSATGGSSVDSNSSTAGQHQSPRNLGGGGIAVVSTGDVTIDASQVDDNSTIGMYSGGIVVGLGSITVTNGSQIDGNSNNGPGGGLAANFGGTVTVSNHSQVDGNTGAALGGGIVNFAGPHGAINITGGSQVNGNTLTNGETIGRVILVFLMTAESQGNSFSDFAASVGGSGGAAMLWGERQVAAAAWQIESSLQQSASQLSLSHPLGILTAGGGIASFVAPVTVSGGSEVNGNLVGQNILGANHTVIGLGGGIFALASRGVTIDDSHVDGNQAPHGDGGGLWLGRGSAQVTDGSSVSNNTASGNGGGIWNKGRLRIQQSTVTGNTSGGKGGGIYNGGLLIPIGANIFGNTPNNVYNA